MENNSNRLQDSKEMVDSAYAEFADKSKNKVFPRIGDKGSIDAYVFSDKGIVHAHIQYDEIHAGKFAFALLYPDTDKIVAAYARINGIPKSDVNITSNDFMAFCLKLFERPDSGYELTQASWDWKYSAYEDVYYSSAQEAVNALWSEDVYCSMPTHKTKR